MATLSSGLQVCSECFDRLVDECILCGALIEVEEADWLPQGVICEKCGL